MNASLGKKDMLKPAHGCVLQGEDTVEVKRKRAMLVEEGVRFEGSRVKPSCVADPADIATRCVGL